MFEKIIKFPLEIQYRRELAAVLSSLSENDNRLVPFSNLLQAQLSFKDLLDKNRLPANAYKIPDFIHPSRSSVSEYQAEKRNLYRKVSQIEKDCEPHLPYYQAFLGVKSLQSHVLKTKTILGHFDFCDIACDRLILHAKEIMSLAPLRWIKITGPFLKEFWSMPEFEKIQSLELTGCGLCDDDFESLKDSPLLENLTWMDIRWNPRLTYRAIENIAQTKWKKLKFIEMSLPTDNPDLSSLADQPSYFDYETLVHDFLVHPQATKLESKYGPQDWLHFHCADPNDFPPHPLIFW